MALSIVTAAEDEPVTVEQVKRQARREGIDDDDEFIEEFLIPAARDRGELATRRQFLRATWNWKRDAFPPCGFLEVPKPPLIDVVSITYVDTSGTTQTWAADQYQVSAPAGPRCQRGRIAPAYGVSWPSTRAQLDAVTIQFRAGYGTAASSVPALLRKAILRDAATLFEHREDVITGTIVAEMPQSAKTIYRSFKSRATR